MSTATDRMLQAVQNAKSSAERAEREYERRERSLEAKATRSIDLFGGTAVTQVADLAKEARDMCDTLYSAYQTLVRMLDEECRPLLDQDPGVLAVGEVRDLIKWLNEESKIRNNFTASLNGHDLGGMATRDYIPLMECKMIESYWDNKYQNMPERLELQRKAEERQREMAKGQEAEYQQKLAQYEKDMEKYRAEMEEFRLAEEKRDQEVREIQQKRDELFARKMKELEDELEKKFQAEFEKKLAELRSKRDDVLDKKGQAEVTLAGLGALKFGEKARLKRQIEGLDANIKEIESNIGDWEMSRVSGLKKALEKAKAKEDELRRNVDSMYPYPPENKEPEEPTKPRKPGTKTKLEENLEIRDKIYDLLLYGDQYSAAEILDMLPETDDGPILSLPRVTHVITTMVTDGVLERVVEKRVAYFRLR